MENAAMDAVTMAGQAGDGLSIWGLFLEADWIVKAVMLLLGAASLWSWAIIFDKLLRLRRLHQKSRAFEDSFWSGGSVEDLYGRLKGQAADPMAAVFLTAMREWKRGAGHDEARDAAARAGVVGRIERVMHITIGREMDRLETHLGFLASVGSTAPFVGLFGTVWGIMNSFQAIAASKNTNLAVVAPGIAEALFATALGLVAAIPAVLAYNKIAKDLDRYAHRLESFAGEFIAILSRQLDERG